MLVFAPIPNPKEMIATMVMMGCLTSRRMP
jgi:hypothetical protein